MNRNLGLQLDDPSEFVHLTFDARRGLHRCQYAVTNSQDLSQVAEITVSAWATMDYHDGGGRDPWVRNGLEPMP